jgi:hypothetical protein
MMARPPNVKPTPTADATVSTPSGATVTTSRWSDRPVVASISTRMTVPQRNASSTLTTTFVAMTRPKPCGDMNSCSSVPHCASRVTSQDSDEYETTATVQRKKPTMMPASESSSAAPATAFPPRKMTRKKR